MIRDAPDATNIAKTASVTVNNSKPTVTITPPSKVYRNVAATFALRALDSPQDVAAGFKYVINWGDGTAAQTIGAKAGNATRNIAHTFTATGTRTVTVRATDRNGAQSDPVTTTVTVIAAPTLQSSSINGGAKQRSRIMNILFTLSQDVGLTKGKLKLTRGAVNVALTNASFTWTGGTQTGNLGLSSTNLVDGNYRLAIDTGGGVLNIDFFRLAGDANGDRKVNASDLTIVNNAFGKSTGQAGFNVNADLNVDGKVDNKDKTIVTQNTGHTLPA